MTLAILLVAMIALPTGMALWLAYLLRDAMREIRDLRVCLHEVMTEKLELEGELRRLARERYETAGRLKGGRL